NQHRCAVRGSTPKWSLLVKDRKRHCKEEPRQKKQDAFDVEYSRHFQGRHSHGQVDQPALSLAPPYREEEHNCSHGNRDAERPEPGSNRSRCKHCKCRITYARDLMSDGDWRRLAAEVVGYVC